MIFGNLIPIKHLHKLTLTSNRSTFKSNLEHLFRAIQLLNESPNIVG